MKFQSISIITTLILLLCFTQVKRLNKLPIYEFLAFPVQFRIISNKLNYSCTPILILLVHSRRINHFYSQNLSTRNRRFKVRMRAIGRHLLSRSLPDLRQNNRSKSLIYIRTSSPPQGIQLIESIVNWTNAIPAGRASDRSDRQTDRQDSLFGPFVSS